MGSFLFKWTHPASEVYVTGTFDDWAKSQKLEKTAAGHFEKLVDLPKADEKIVYKFVVDDNWTTDHTAPTQIDEHGNSNNILLPEHIIKKSTGTVGGVAADLPGAFPETPATSTENQAFSVKPIPATAGIGNPVKLAAGEPVPHPSTLTRNTVDSTATMDKASYDNSSSGAPVLPNPVTPDSERERAGVGMFGLPPITSALIPESSLPMGEGAAAGLEKDPGVTIQSGGGAPTTAALAGQVPLEPRGVATEEVDSNVAIRSGGGAPTTATLAGSVPLEPRSVPVPVRDSQDQAADDARGASVEASRDPTAVLEKKSVNQEVEKSVPTAPATATGEQSVGAKVAEIAGGAAAGATAAVAAAAAYASKATDSLTSDETKEAAKAQAASAQETAGNAATQAKESAAVAATTASASAAAAAATVKSKLPESVQQKLEGVLPGDAKGTGSEAPAAQVPAEVKESIAESHQPAEAAVNPTQVSNKSIVENELLESVKPTDAAGAPAPTATAATSSTAPTTINKSTESPLAASAPGAAAGGAAGAAGAAALTSGGLNAPGNAPTTTTAANPKPPASRDVSPMTRVDQQGQPTATSGVATSSIPATSTGTTGTPGAATNTSTTNPAVTAAKSAAANPTQVAPASPSSPRPDTSAGEEGSDKKHKRRSFFGKIKDKIQHKRQESKSGDA